MNERLRSTRDAGRRLAVLLAGVVLVLAAACGGAMGAHPSPTSSQPGTPSPPQTGLFAALQASDGQSWRQPDTILIVGRDGHVYARATFKPRAIPWILPDLGALLPPVAHVAGGRAYYIDGGGVVRSLGWTGGVREETRFPVTTTQQEASFAVSPDGRTFVGSVVTFPPEPNPAPTPPYTPVEPYSMDLMTASAGGAATVTFHQEWQYATLRSSGAQFVAWDVGGPVAVYPAGLGTQGGAPHQYNGPTLVHFPGGKPGSALPAPAAWWVQDLIPDGTYVVASLSSGGLQVRATDGSTLWSRPGPAAGSYLYTFLAPDGQHVVTLAPDGDQVLGRDGTTATITGMSHGGWLDAQTVVGTTGANRLAYVALGDLSRVVDLGLNGDFAGSLG